MHWIDGSRCKQISAALSEAHAAFNTAYYESPTNVDLFIATERVSRALNKVRREIRKNQPGSAEEL
ncbi:MAG: hypothetical protein VYA67_22095 [Actinomycetota bacterium]|nr:hypothetical protein [Actinomycetota bacterium]